MSTDYYHTAVLPYVDEVIPLELDGLGRCARAATAPPRGQRETLTPVFSK